MGGTISRHLPGIREYPEAAKILRERVAKSAYYTWLWACFSVKSLILVVVGCGFLGLLLKCSYLFRAASSSMSCQADIFSMLFKCRIVCPLAGSVTPVPSAPPSPPYTHVVMVTTDFSFFPPPASWDWLSPHSPPLIKRIVTVNSQIKAGLN